MVSKFITLSLMTFALNSKINDLFFFHWGVCECISVCMHAGTHGGQERALGCQEVVTGYCKLPDMDVRKRSRAL